MKVGIAVTCAECGRTKKPIGRSGPFESYYCDFECPGYRTTPMPGCLWPGETEKEFGYPVSKHATKEVEASEDL